jgi:hypothetical protein
VAEYERVEVATDRDTKRLFILLLEFWCSLSVLLSFSARGPCGSLCGRLPLSPSLASPCFAAGPGATHGEFN